MVKSVRDDFVTYCHIFVGGSFVSCEVTVVKIVCDLGPEAIVG